MSSIESQNQDPFGAALRDPAFLENTKRAAALRNMSVEQRRQHNIAEFEAAQAAAEKPAEPAPAVAAKKAGGTLRFTLDEIGAAVRNVDALSFDESGQPILDDEEQS